MITVLSSILRACINHSRYPSPIRHILSVTGRANIKKDQTASVYRNVSIQGKVYLDKQSIIKRGTDIIGEVDIGQDVCIGPESILRGGPLKVGKGTNLVGQAEIAGEVKIGRYCAIARRAIIHAENHDMKRPSIQEGLLAEKIGAGTGIKQGKITIGDDVWFGKRTTVLPKTRVGDGAVVGAGSVVTRDVEPYEVVAGVPAERLGWRFREEVRSFLSDLRWWEWSAERMIANQDFFRMRLNESSMDEINQAIQ
jgi:virginiamycin A acetyltransferase